MKLTLAFASLSLMLSATVASSQPPPIEDPALLNIGLACQWKGHCIAKQQQAMFHALKYVTKHRPPSWKIQFCNHNASRRQARVDWIGFRNCIRNRALPRAEQARTRLHVGI